MKKSRFYLSMAIVALSWMGCSQEEEVVNQMQMGGGKTINATIESTTRSTVTDAGVFSWTTGDAISLHDGINVDTYTYSGTGNGFNPPTPAEVSNPVVAYYPASKSHTATEFYLPNEYGDTNTDYVASTNAAMIATPPTSGNEYAFMHLGGVMRFNVKNVPAGADGFKFTASNKNINGSFNVIEKDGVKTIETIDGEKNSVTICFKTSDAPRDMTFYVPMPTGTYGDYTVSLRINGTLISHTSEDVTNTINRKTLLLMPTFTYDATTGKLEKGTAKVGVIDLEDGDESANIEASADIVVTPGENADATATLNYTPADDGSSALSISDGSGETTSGESEGNVVVSTADGSTVASCDINTPSLTVELSAADNGTATYQEVTALTAEQTLIIGEGVTINKLIVKGGNVVLKGNVKSIESEVATTIKLENDIESDEIITISGPITLDGNDKTLTSTATRAINVDTDGSVTIQKLTINAAERAINIIDKAATVNVNKVTATANNNAIMIATSAGAAKLTVEDSDLTGLAVINVAGEGAQVEIKNTKITNVDPVGTDAAYGAITISGTAENSKVNVDTNSTITVADNSKKAYVFPGTAVIEGVDNVGYVYATIGDNGCETLAKAIEEAEAGQTITILRDITVSEIITINKAITLDGNGKTLTSTVSGTSGRAINVSGANGVTIKNLTINASGERAINIIQNATNVTIDNVTATAANYTVNVAKSAPNAIVKIVNSTLNGLCTVNVSSPSANVTIEKTKIVCNDQNANENYAALTLTADATNAKIIATETTFDIKGDSMQSSNSANNGSISINGQEVVANPVAIITYPGPYYYSFFTLEDAIEYAKAGETVTLIRDIEITELVKVEKAITIDLNEKTVTANCQKAFEIYANATIKNGTIISQQRCVDTRKAVNLTLTDLTLKAPTYYAAYGNQQPLTIGGSEGGTKVTMSNVTMDAGTQGYCIISFVKTELTATESNLSGYAALYVKAGSENSTFNFVKSTLSGTTGNNDVEGNSFATIAIEANNVTVTMDNDCTLNSTGTYHTETDISESATGSTITGPAAE